MHAVTRTRHAPTPGALTRSLVLALAAALMALAWPAPGAAGERTFSMKIGFATIHQHEWAKRWKDRLEKRTGGRIRAQVFPASQLGSIPRMIEGVQLGTIESWLGPPEFLVGVDPRFQVLSAPYLFDDVDHAYRAINDREFLDRFLPLAEDKGIKGVGLIVYTAAGFVSRTPIRSPEDMRGKKYRVLATPIETAMLAALGAAGVPMPLGEVLTALQQGAVDGVEGGITVFTSFKYYDVVKYHANTNHYVVTSIATVSKKWYDALPSDLQRAVGEEARGLHGEIHEWMKAAYARAEKTWIEKTRDGLILLTPEQRAAFRARIEGSADKVAKEIPQIKEWLDYIRAKARQTRR
ncbi:MAG: TRAP transporter substrate-binding protein [Deltaproteobacteria bacterium]|nr:TRAP transporter substrate-binding protein [Deltaproteobacteria bacterium]